MRPCPAGQFTSRAGAKTWRCALPPLLALYLAVFHGADCCEMNGHSWPCPQPLLPCFLHSGKEQWLWFQCRPVRSWHNKKPLHRPSCWPDTPRASWGFLRMSKPSISLQSKAPPLWQPPPHLGKCPPSAGLLTTAPGNPQTLAPGSFHFSKHYEHIYCILVFRNSGKWLSIKACTFLASYLWKNKWGGDGLDGNSKTT